METLIDVRRLDHVAAPKCSDFDEDCVDVVNPAQCMAGDSRCPPSDGYCPMLFKSK